MRQFIYILCLSICLAACKSDTTIKDTSENAVAKTEKSDLPTWAKDATIYEVNMRQFTEEGTFEAFSSHLQRIKDMGVDIIWLMPIHPISKEKRKGELGSPYAVGDYKAVNPEYGTMDDFDAMVKRIHDLGMKIIIDWVPNHTGWDNPWISAHPDWYTQNDKGEIIDPIDYNTGESWGWTDVADLNYDNAEMRKEMIETLKYWITDRKVDGFRMDVAHGVPDDFWQECNKELKATGDVFLLAEGEVPKQRNEGGFHADYGWTLHHKLNEIAKGEKNAEDIWKYYTEDSTKFSKGFHMNFTSNHDENTWAGTVFDRMGDGHRAMAVLTATFDGMPLVYGGQEEPMKKRLEFFKKDPIGFKDYAYQDFYTDLLRLKKDNKALFNGEYGGRAVRISNQKNILAFAREKDGNEVIGVINLSNQPQKAEITRKLDQSRIKIISEGATQESENSISLEPWGYAVYAVYAE